MKVKLIIEISGVMEDYEGEALDWIGDEIEKYCDPNAEVIFWEEGDTL